MLIEDINVRDDIIIISIPTSKNGTSRQFVVIEPLWIHIIKKYLSIRPTPDMKRAFILFRNGKPTRQNMGHNTIGKIPKNVATFLKLNNVASYTGHTFRRTSATILAENGGDLLSLKRHGGWKSATVAEGYIEQSIADKKRIAGMVQGTSSFCNAVQKPTISTETAMPEVEMCNIKSGNFPSQPSLAATEASEVYPVSFESAQINIPLENNCSSTSVNTKATTINMTCNNCTINNYYYK
jgi:hypothetical protein